MNRHNHSCQCDHEEVKFCKTCRIIHCLSCNQEWRPKVSFSSYTWNGGYLGNSVTSGNYPSTVGITPTGASGEGTTFKLPLINCEHK